jgi:DNA polymerase-3 subunit alpha
MDSIDAFISRKHGKEPITYKTPELEDILKVTYGCIVYQEQVMQICRRLAGYSYARADLVRRAMSKKKSDVMLAERANFVEGCAERGINDAVANEIFDDMVSFAKYAFNKSHATAYSVISYRTAYLKAHYPKEYFAALFTSVLDNAAKIREYIADAAKAGVKVLPPDINLSMSDFTVTEEGIRFGLLAIKNVGRNFTEAIVKERNKGAFKSFDEFVHRLSDSDINKRTLDSFIKCGVFDSLGVPRSVLISVYESILESEQTKKRNNISGQLDLFSLSMGESIENSGYVYPEGEEYSLKELLLLEKENSGMYFSGHMIDNYSNHLDSISPDRIADIREDFENSESGESLRYKDGINVKIGGIIMSKKTKALKNGDTMAFIELEDKLGEIEVVVFAKHYERYANELHSENAVLIEGRLSSEDNDEPKLLLSRLTPLKSNSEYTQNEVNANQPTPQRLFIKLDAFDENKLTPIYRISNLNPGKCAVIIFDSATKKYTAIKNAGVNPSEKVLTRLKSLFGAENVVLK